MRGFVLAEYFSELFAHFVDNFMPVKIENSFEDLKHLYKSKQMA